MSVTTIVNNSLMELLWLGLYMRTSDTSGHMISAISCLSGFLDNFFGFGWTFTTRLFGASDKCPIRLKSKLKTCPLHSSRVAFFEGCRWLVLVLVGSYVVLLKYYILKTLEFHGFKHIFNIFSSSYYSIFMTIWILTEKSTQNMPSLPQLPLHNIANTNTPPQVLCSATRFCFSWCQFPSC